MLRTYKVLAIVIPTLLIGLALLSPGAFSFPNENIEPVDNRLNKTAVERGIHDEINDRRISHDLEPLTYDKKLAGIAKSHSRDMTERDYFAHESPDGQSLIGRYNEAGYNCRVKTDGDTYLNGGENLATTWWRENIKMESGEIVSHDSETELAKGIVNQWMNSTGHRKNILKPSWNSEGVGIAISEEDKVYATQNFC